MRCEGWEERQAELVMMLNEAMTSMCTLLELAAQAIEDADAERDRSEETEPDANMAERGFGSGSGSSIDDRPLNWLITVNVPSSGQPVSPSTNPCRSISTHLYIEGATTKAISG